MMNGKQVFLIHHSSFIISLERRANCFCKLICLAPRRLAGVFAFLDGDVLQRMIDEFDFVNVWKAPASRPDSIPAANRDRQDWDVGFQSHANCAGLESEQLAVRQTAPAFWIDNHCAAASEPLQCPAQHRFVRLLDLDGPGPQRCYYFSNDRPAETF